MAQYMSCDLTVVKWIYLSYDHAFGITFGAIDDHAAKHRAQSPNDVPDGVPQAS